MWTYLQIQMYNLIFKWILLNKEMNTQSSSIQWLLLSPVLWRYFCLSCLIGRDHTLLHSCDQSSAWQWLCIALKLTIVFTFILFNLKTSTKWGSIFFQKLYIYENVMKDNFQDTAWLLRSWLHSSYSYLPNICTKLRPANNPSLIHKGLWGPILSLRGYWQLLVARRRRRVILFNIVDADKLVLLHNIMMHTHMHTRTNTQKHACSPTHRFMKATSSSADHKRKDMKVRSGLVGTQQEYEIDKSR